MNNPSNFPPGSSSCAGRDNPESGQRGEYEQQSQRVGQYGGDAPQQGQGAVQYGARPGTPDQQYGQNAGFGPPPPSPRRYNVWGMDYSPYDRGGLYAEQGRAAVPQYRQQGQNSDYGPPPPPPKRYNVWGMDYSPYDQVGSTSQQHHQGGPSSNSSSVPPPPQEAYDMRGINEQPYPPDGGQSSSPGRNGGQDNRR